MIPRRSTKRSLALVNFLTQSVTVFKNRHLSDTDLCAKTPLPPFIPSPTSAKHKRSGHRLPTQEKKERKKKGDSCVMTCRDNCSYLIWPSLNMYEKCSRNNTSNCRAKKQALFLNLFANYNCIPMIFPFFYDVAHGFSKY